MQIINSKAINRMEYKMLKFSIKKYIKIDNHNFVSKISEKKKISFQKRFNFRIQLTCKNKKRFRM